MDTKHKAPMVLIILDGFGYREATESNAIFHANTPFWDGLWREQPHTLISGSGLDVGLPEGQMGNSEVGHMSLGAGRVIYQSITRIDKSISDGDFYTNPAYTAAVDRAIANEGAVHIMGLLSPGGVHSHETHIQAMAKLAAERGAKHIYIHAILDGRDTPPRSAKGSLEAMENTLKQLGVGHIATIIGRYFAMDRDNRWDRVAKAYDLYTLGIAEVTACDAVSALAAAYERGEDDEFVKATAIPEAGTNVTINDGDALIFMNFRADRAREITRAFVDADFAAFERKKHPQIAFVQTTEYASSIKAPCAYGPESLDNVLGDYLAQQGKTQLRIAETEKYAHVTFFFSGGREETFPGEERILVPSPDVATYDLQPEMSAPEVTDRLVEAIISGKFDAIICNYANGDMVGHTGVFEAAVKAVEALDLSLRRVAEAVQRVGGQMLITADHGNCEQMLDPESGQAHTAHTCDRVPLVYVGDRKLHFTVDDGRLADIAPTMLSLMGLPIPAEMTGRTIVAFD